MDVDEESAVDKVVVCYGEGKQLKIGKVNFLKHQTMRLLLLIALFQQGEAWGW